jgi:phosphatidylserine decarboxylase
MEIQPAADEEYEGEGIRVSVFLSVFNVHVNRAPIAGTVDFVHWHRGRFRAAYKPDASLDNEHSAIGISSGQTRLVVKQIVGVLARRIACYLSPGDEVALGARFGLIRFGSRVDHILPGDAELKVQVGDRVRAGETVIGIHQQTGV